MVDPSGWLLTIADVSISTRPLAHAHPLFPDQRASEHDGVTIGLLQFAPQARTIAENLDFIVRRVCHLQDAIIVLPEFFLGSYTNHPLFFLCEPELRSLLAPLLDLSRRRRLSLVGSLPIDSHGRSFNRAFLIDKGEIRYIYDKTRLYGDEQHRFSWGDTESHVLTIEEVKCSVRICLDIVDPVALRTPMSEGVQLILGPSAVSVDFLRTIHQARAFENQAVSLFCNRCGVEPGSMTQYLGRSAIFFPDGSARELGPDDELLEVVRLSKPKLAATAEGKKAFLRGSYASSAQDLDTQRWVMGQQVVDPWRGQTRQVAKGAPPPCLPRG